MTSLAVMQANGQWAAYVAVAAYTLNDGVLRVTIQRGQVLETQMVTCVVGLLVGPAAAPPAPHFVVDELEPWKAGR